MIGQTIFYGGSFGLIAIGLYIILAKKNLLRIVIGLSFIESGVNLFLISIGYIFGRTAPILSKPELLKNPGKMAVDPVPQALVLTAIVIGVAVMAMALSIVVRIYKHYGTLNIHKIKELRW